MTVSLLSHQINIVRQKRMYFCVINVMFDIDKWHTYITSFLRQNIYILSLVLLKIISRHVWKFDSYEQS